MAAFGIENPSTVQHVPLSSQINEYLKSGPPLLVQYFILIIECESEKNCPVQYSALNLK